MADNAEPTTDPQPAEEPKSAAPWTAETFDAERAWRRIENMQADLDKVKAERDSLRQAAQEAADAEKTEAQKAADRAKAAEDRAAAAERALFVERAVRKYDLDPEIATDFLTGDTEDEIVQKAEKLAGLGKPKADEDPTPEAPQSGRPDPELRPVPGHGGEAPAPFDPAAIAAAARQSSY